MVNEKKQAVSYDAPIPGQSLTAPLGDRPWQRPARFPTAEQALEFYVDRITQERQSNQLLDLLELGVPIDSLVDTMQLGGVMEGMHSVDVGIVISPALAETIKSMADAAEIDYVFTSEELEDSLPTKSEVALGMQHLRSKPKGIQIKTEEEPVEQEVETEDTKPTGLMARRNADV